MAEQAVMAIDSRHTTAAVPREPTPSVMDLIARAATDPSVDIDKMERLMAMHERLTARQAEADFNEAMTQVQAETRAISADANNPQTKSRYASYFALDKALRPIYTKHGFSLTFDTGDDSPADHVKVLCHCGHKNGHTRTYRVLMPADGKGAKGGDVMTKTHAAGSAFSYGQRYLLKLIFNVAVGDDDDGNKGGATPITAEQKAELIDLIRRSESDVPKFLAYLKVAAEDGVDGIMQSQFATAKAALNAALAAKQKKGAI